MSTTPQPPAGMPGLLLAELHGTAYVRVDGVFAVRGDQIAYYGDPAAFEQSPVWAEVSRLRRIAQLQAELAALEAQQPPPELAPPAKRRGRAAATAVALPAPAEATPAPAGGPFVCSLCGKGFRKAHGLNVHQAVTHGSRRPPPAPAPPAPPAVVVEADDPKAEARP